MSSKLLGLPQVLLLDSRHKVAKLIHLKYEMVREILTVIASDPRCDATHRKLEVLDNFVQCRCEGVVVGVRENVVNPPVLIK